MTTAFVLSGGANLGAAQAGTVSRSVATTCSGVAASSRSENRR